MLPVVLPAFILGLISSLHCVGMCGPLMLALPVRHLPRGQQVFSVLLYNLGRLFTYSIIGVVIGLVGRKIYLSGFQQWFSIAAGITILVIAVLYYFLKKSLQPAWMIKAHIHLQQVMGTLMAKGNRACYFLLGAANGLLPCGMVYMAIAGAFMMQRVEQSVLFMLLFGAGTVPAMMALSMFSMRISLPVRQQLRKAMPVFIVGIAVLLILRGMNLGIPFVSPVLGDARHGISCP